MKEEEKGNLSDKEKELNEYYRTYWAELNEDARHNHSQYNTIVMSISSAIITFSTLKSSSFTNPRLLKWSSIILGFTVIFLTFSFLTGNKDIEEVQKTIHAHFFEGEPYKPTKWNIITKHLNCLSAFSFVIGIFLFILSK